MNFFFVFPLLQVFNYFCVVIPLLPLLPIALKLAILSRANFFAFAAFSVAVVAVYLYLASSVTVVGIFDFVRLLSRSRRGMNYARFHIHQPLKFGGLAVRRSLNFVLDLPQKFFIRNIKMEVNEDCNLRNGTSNSRGALVVLEGLDRCGKTTQSSSLVKYLKECGHSAELWRFPDRSTSVGQMISSYLTNESQLDDHTIHLLFSANRWEKRMMMETKLKAGITLIVDRYSYSGVAFSSAKGLGIDWCKAPEAGLLAPDLVLYLDILPEKAAERGDYGSERYEKLDFQKKVAQCYRDLCDVSWKIIDACQPVADIEKQVQEIVIECVIKCQNGVPLSHLWLN